jgi:hypothetical protein
MELPVFGQEVFYFTKKRFLMGDFRAPGSIGFSKFKDTSPVLTAFHLIRFPSF